MINKIEFIKRINNKDVTIAETDTKSLYAFRFKVTEEGKKYILKGDILIKDGYIYDCKLRITDEGTFSKTVVYIDNMLIAPQVSIDDTIYRKPDYKHCCCCGHELKDNPL